MTGIRAALTLVAKKIVTLPSFLSHPLPGTAGREIDPCRHGIGIEIHASWASKNLAIAIPINTMVAHALPATSSNTTTYSSITAPRVPCTSEVHSLGAPSPMLTSLPALIIERRTLQRSAVRCKAAAFVVASTAPVTNAPVSPSKRAISGHRTVLLMGCVRNARGAQNPLGGQLGSETGGKGASSGRQNLG